MSLHSKQSLYERLRDRKFREAFVSSRIAHTIATQARVLRQRQDMSQAEVARLLGTSQNAIYRLENPKYGRPNISTLKKLASLFDVGLIVRFAPFSEIVDWTINLSEKSMEIENFTEENEGFEKAASAEALEPMAMEAFANGNLAPQTPLHGSAVDRSKALSQINQFESSELGGIATAQAARRPPAQAIWSNAA
jgi:transcriptional regulator with XRE-family HTH domain